MKNLTLAQWIAIGSGVLLVLQQFKIIDLSKTPILGQILVKLGLSPAPPAVPSVDPLLALPATDGTAPHTRCEHLSCAMKQVRHFLAEQPAGDARDLLDACDKIDKIIKDAAATK